MSELLWTEQQFTPRSEPGRVIRYHKADITSRYPGKLCGWHFTIFEYPTNYKIVAEYEWTDDTDIDVDPFTGEMIAIRKIERDVVCIRLRADVEDLDTFIEDALRAYRW